MKNNSWFFILLLALGLAAGGCGKGSADASAFSTASPEIKTLWDKATQASGSNDYVPAVLICRTLAAREDITPKQKTAVENQLSDVYSKMNTSAGNGDKKAQEAIDELKKIGRPRN